MDSRGGDIILANRDTTFRRLESPMRDKQGGGGRRFADLVVAISRIALTRRTREDGVLLDGPNMGGPSTVPIRTADPPESRQFCRRSILWDGL